MPLTSHVRPQNPPSALAEAQFRRQEIQDQAEVKIAGATQVLRKAKVSMSRSHKLIAFLYLLALAIVIFIHYPFGRYHSTAETSVVRGEGECPKASSVEELKAMTADQLRQSVLCRQSYSETADLPILEWRSEESLLYWFSSLSHTLSFAALLTLVAGMSAIFFSSSSSSRLHTDP